MAGRMHIVEIDEQPLKAGPYGPGSSSARCACISAI